ncbi:DUF2279 domain-containing protein [Flavobacterium sp. TSSA_36]|uniref:DUF2279 domain-containing protein n=1 Tax=Flavobacterium sp. TSSA_36 TaxID=3447669 RepID=UPI003F3D3A23
MFRLLLFFWSTFGLFAQEAPNSFFTPSDSLNIQRRNAVIITETVLGGATLVGLNQLWYADYPKSNFHFINDNAEWLQMDKIGHFYSAYHLGRFGAEALQWSGVKKRDQLLYGATLGFVFLSAVEVMDGFSAEWGASSGDIIANALGTGLYISQELLWKEQRITPKFSFHTTAFAGQNPNKLGSSFSEQLLKDYNGQTYWLSVNLDSFFSNASLPKWLNVALGYGADGMLKGMDSNDARERQFYLSLDINLQKIRTNNSFLKTVFSVFNTLKVPAPTLSYSSSIGLKAHSIYF